MSNSERRFLFVFKKNSRLFFGGDFCFVLFGEEARGSILSLSVCLSGQIDARCAGFCKPVIVTSLCWWLAFLFLSPTPRPSFVTRCFLRFCGLAILEADFFGGAKLWRVFFKSGRFAAILLQDFDLKIFVLPENGELVNRRLKREEGRNGTEEEKEL